MIKIGKYILDAYPYLVCRDCGKSYGKSPDGLGVAWWHNDKCEVCNEKKEVTRPREFGHLKYQTLKRKRA